MLSSPLPLHAQTAHLTADGPWIGQGDLGPEAARNYLWLAQDFWLAPDILAWVAADPDIYAMLLQLCAREGCQNRETFVFEFKHCGNCHNKIYCGRECQKSDWASHKPRMSFHCAYGRCTGANDCVGCRFVYHRYPGLEKKRVVPINRLVSRVEDALIDCPYDIGFYELNMDTSSEGDIDEDDTNGT